jgi:plasmid maintenance system antidote protein VapI
MGIRTQLFNLIVHSVHSKLLHTDKIYFKEYAKKIGIKERDLRMLLNGTYDGTVPNLIIMARNIGVVVDVTWEKIK